MYLRQPAYSSSSMFEYGNESNELNERLAKLTQPEKKQYFEKIVENRSKRQVQKLEVLAAKERSFKASLKMLNVKPIPVQPQKLSRDRHQIFNRCLHFICQNERQQHIENSGECSICIEPFKKGDILSMIPRCSHIFHCRCIQGWISQKSSCPNCRNTSFSSQLSQLAKIQKERDSVIQREEQLISKFKILLKI